MAYPWVSNIFSQKAATSTVSAYEEAVEDAGDQEIAEALAAAEEYNLTVQRSQIQLTDPFDPALADAMEAETDAEYSSLLNLSRDGVMCYVDIPAISVYLPVFHGTSDNVLSAGAGHLEGSSLPVGGESTHAVITGHTGLTSAKMFTDLTELEEGDLFYIHVLGKVLAYEVSEIQVVLPENTTPLLVREGEDLVTLVTCTPYGVNTYRLLVTGTRTEYSAEAYEDASSDAAGNAVNSLWMRSYRNAVMAGLAIIAGVRIAIGVILKIWKKKKKQAEDAAGAGQDPAGEGRKGTGSGKERKGKKERKP